MAGLDRTLVCLFIFGDDLDPDEVTTCWEPNSRTTPDGATSDPADRF